MVQKQPCKTKPVHRLIRIAKDNIPSKFGQLIDGTKKTSLLLIIFSLEILWLNSFLYDRNILSVVVNFILFLLLVAKGYFICSFKSRMNIEDTEHDKKDMSLLIQTVSNLLQRICSMSFLYGFLVCSSMYYIINNSLNFERFMLVTASFSIVVGFFLLNEYSFKFDVNK